MEVEVEVEVLWRDRDNNALDNPAPRIAIRRTLHAVSTAGGQARRCEDVYIIVAAVVVVVSAGFV